MFLKLTTMLVAMKKMQKLHLCLHVIWIPSPDFLSYQQNRKGNTSKTWYPKLLPHKNLLGHSPLFQCCAACSKVLLLIMVYQKFLQLKQQPQCQQLKTFSPVFQYHFSEQVIILSKKWSPAQLSKTSTLQVKCNLKYKHFIEFKPP